MVENRKFHFSDEHSISKCQKWVPEMFTSLPYVNKNFFRSIFAFVVVLFEHLLGIQESISIFNSLFGWRPSMNSMTNRWKSRKHVSFSTSLHKWCDEFKKHTFTWFGTVFNALQGLLFKNSHFNGYYHRCRLFGWRQRMNFMTNRWKSRKNISFRTFPR